MKRLLTTAAIVAAMTLPAFAEGDDASAKAGDAKAGTVKSTTSQNNPSDQAGSMGRARTTTGAASTPQQNELEKSKNTSGADSGDTGGRGGDSGGSGGAGGGSGGGSSR